MATPWLDRIRGIQDRERAAKDFAIEWGEYLAKSAESFRDTWCNEEASYDERLDTLKNLNSYIYEFRKRAKRANQ